MEGTPCAGGKWRLGRPEHLWRVPSDCARNFPLMVNVMENTEHTEHPESKLQAAVESRWQRLLFIVLFVVVFEITKGLVYLVLAVQFLLRLLVGSVNGNLRSLGRVLGLYAAEIIDFLTYASDRLPFPFSPWPHVPEEEEHAE